MGKKKGAANPTAEKRNLEKRVLPENKISAVKKSQIFHRDHIDEGDKKVTRIGGEKGECPDSISNLENSLISGDKSPSSSGETRKGNNAKMTGKERRGL